MKRIIRESAGGALILLGLLAMVSVEPGQALWPYIAVMAASLAAVAVGARMGGWWRSQSEKRRKGGDGYED